MGEERYPSVVPFLPPLTDATIREYFRFYIASVGTLVLFGGLLAPMLEVRLGLGGAPLAVRGPACLLTCNRGFKCCKTSCSFWGARLAQCPAARMWHAFCMEGLMGVYACLQCKDCQERQLWLVCRNFS